MTDKLSLYINDRIRDLCEDRYASTDERDIAWIARLMQELDWVHQVHTGTYTHDCVLARVPELETKKEK